MGEFSQGAVWAPHIATIARNKIKRFLIKKKEMNDAWDDVEISDT